MKAKFSAVSLFVLFALGVSNASAALIPITNASFEDGAPFANTSPQGDYSFGSFTGWVVTGAAGRYDPTGVLTPEAVDGSSTAFSNGGSLLQTLGANLTANTTYTLSLFVGDRTDTTLPSFTVELLAGGSALTGGSTIYSAPANGGWSSYAYTFTSLVDGGPLAIRLASSATQTNFDNLSLNAVAAVPEAETSAMFLAGLGLLGFVSRRRKHS